MSESVLLEVRFSPEPDYGKPTIYGPRSPYIGVRNMSDDHDIHFQFVNSVPPGERPRAGGICHFTLNAGDHGWKPLTGPDLGAFIWATRKARDPMDDGMGGW